MNYSTAVMLINPSIRAIHGKYEESGKIETFKTIDAAVKIDDYVVVESGTRWNITTVKVVAVDVDVDFDAPTAIKWVVQKVDINAHAALKVMEDQAIAVIKAGELRKRREDIRKNTLDAVASGEIDGLAIAKLAPPKVDPAA